MNVITLDFETYYDTGFSLSRLTTEEYIRSPEFEMIGVGVKVNDASTYWVSGSRETIFNKLKKLPWRDSMLLCHNTMFDGAILAWFCKISPAMYLDTLCMARALHGVDAGGSLKALAERYEIGEKGEEVIHAKGKRLADFSPEELHRYGQYCINDVELTHKLFSKMGKHFSQQEMASNPKFAALLKEFNVEPPMKVSPRTGKETYALAKNDEGFITLTEHEDTFVQHLCSVRLGTKSTIEESRIQRFIDVASRNNNRMPIPLKYYGAHTGRWAGSDKINFQNLPSRDKKKKTLKNAIMAPDGYVVINSDSSQIEARVLVWLAGQTDVVQMFAEGRDVYSEFATKIYKKQISKADPIERFVGKTCILGLGYGTGAKKLQHTLKTQPPGAVVELNEAKRIVNIYRDENDKIPDLWNECDKVLSDIALWPMDKEPYHIGVQKCVMATPDGIRLPSGFYIRYPELKLDASEDQSRMVYKSRKGPVNVWGGGVVENIVQGLARCIVAEQMLMIGERYRPSLTVHDSVVCIAPEDEAEEAIKFIVQCMNTQPEWAHGLPITCEATFGKSYGEC
jgi:DNA polymerase I-like protein with 3'-5' exonuclease and polymerase domains